MSYCVNPDCPQPKNPDSYDFCYSCGAKLLLKERYRPLYSLGCGGFGRTFLAIDEEAPLQPRCVVKQFYFRDRDSEHFNKAIELFHQEAERLDELGKHPQIPYLLAHFEQEQQHYLVQEYIEGKTLKQELEEIGVYSEAQIWKLLCDLLPVLQFIHEHRVIHRDIKPENIIRRSCNGQPVLIDFGIAKLLTDTALLRPATLIGSQDYIAPEQTRGKVFPASDLYSLGVTCIRLLTKVPPLDMYDFDCERWWWREYLPQKKALSYQLGQILDKLLQSPIIQRYQSATEVLKDINLALDARPELLNLLPTINSQVEPVSESSTLLQISPDAITELSVAQPEIQES